MLDTSSIDFTKDAQLEIWVVIIIRRVKEKTFEIGFQCQLGVTSNSRVPPASTPTALGLKVCAIPLSQKMSTCRLVDRKRSITISLFWYTKHGERLIYIVGELWQNDLMLNIAPSTNTTYNPKWQFKSKLLGNAESHTVRCGKPCSLSWSTIPSSVLWVLPVLGWGHLNMHFLIM